MSFAAPWFLLGLLALGPLIALHLRRRRRQQEVASLLLWRAQAAAAPRRRWAAPVWSLPLALQIAFVVLVVLALAQPQSGGGVREHDAPVAVFVVDGSAAMGGSAASGAGGSAAPGAGAGGAAAGRAGDRMAAARRIVAERLEQLPQGTAVGLVLAGPSPRLLLDRGSPAEARAALTQARPQRTAGDLWAGVALAGGQLGPAGGSVTLVHGAEQPAPRVRADGISYAAVAVGSLGANQAIEPPVARCGPRGGAGPSGGARADGAGQGGDGGGGQGGGTRTDDAGAGGGDGAAACSVFAAIRNDGDTSARRRLEVSRSGRVISSREVAVAPGERAEVVSAAEPGARLELRLSGDDALATDDRAVVTVPDPAAPVDVTLVSDRPRTAPLARALAATPGVTLDLVAPDDYDRDASAGAAAGAGEDADAAAGAGAGSAGADPRASLLVLDRVLPGGELPEARAVLLVDPPRLPGGRVGGALGDATLSGTAAGAPLLAGVDLGALVIGAGTAGRVALPPALRAVAWAPGGPLIASGETAGPARLIALLTFDPQASTLPQLPAFPILVANVVDWARQADDDTDEFAGGDAVASGAGDDAAAGGPSGTVDDAAAGGVSGAGEDAAAFGASATVPLVLRAGDGGAGVPTAAREWWPWLTGAALVVLLVEWSLLLRGWSGRWAWAAAGLRGAAAVALVAAIALALIDDGDDAPTVIVLDRSASIDPAMTARERAWVRSAVEEGACADPCRVVAFAGTASFAGVSSGGLLPAGATLGADATDLAAATRLATGALPDGGRVVLLTDGFDSTPGAGLAAALADARRAGVRIDAVPLTGAVRGAGAGGDGANVDDGRFDARERDAAVTRLVVPSPLRAGDELTVQATVRSTVAGRAAIALALDGAVLGREQVTLRAGDNPLLLSYRAPAEGWHGYRLTVDLPGDRVAANDALDAATRIGPAPRALVVEGRPGSAGELPDLLARDGVTVTTTDAAGLADALGAAADGGAEVGEAADTGETGATGIEAGADGGAAGDPAPDAVALADVPARALPAPAVTALTAAVRERGSGLVVLGGERSLSLGGYAGTALDALLPVASLRPGGLRRRRLALQLVLDRSSSMNDLAGGLDPKIAMARTAARTAVALAARAGDELGIVAFDAVARDVVPLQRVTAASAGALDGLIDRLDADGGTNLARGLARGIDQLAASDAPVRHMIAIGDGVSEPADYAPLIERMRAERITLSTIALGQDADVPLLRRLARATGGRFLAVPDARALPRVLAREARRAAPSVAIRAELPVAAGAASPVVSSLSGAQLPPLRGTVLTNLRAGATAPLSTEVNGETVPVLAQGQQGLGRVVVWTPGAGDWAGDWLTARPQPFAAALRWAARPLATPALEPALAPGDPSAVVVDPLATAGRPFDLGEVSGTAEAPGGTRSSLTFEQVAPSTYVAALGGDAPAGVHGIGVDASDGIEPAPAGAQALLAVPYAAERLPLPPEAGRGGQLAALGGGAVLAADDPAAAFAPGGEGPLQPLLLAAAVALLLAAVAAGRLRGHVRR